MTATLLRNVAKVATGDVERPLIDGPVDIRIADGRIASIGAPHSGGGASGSAPAGAGADLVLDASGLTAMPGLWDAHYYPYFGDHSVQFDARGSLAETVRAGTTSVVSAGTIDFPGRPRDALGEREVAILAQRSWIYDRPLEIHVHSGTVVAAAGMNDRDVAALENAGVRRLVVRGPRASGDAPFSSDEARDLVKAARAHRMTVVALPGVGPLVAGARSVAEALAAIDADVVLAVNGGDVALPDAVTNEIITNGRACIGLALTGSLTVARRIVSALASRNEARRILLGTATPSPRAVLPSGMQRFVQLVAGATSALTPPVAVALATGNAARAYGLPGGRLAPGEPADLLLARAPRGGPSPDAFDAIVRGDWLEIDSVFIDGVAQAGARWTA